MNRLLSRDSFRSAILERDNHKCVVCACSATAAHHIMERRLFDDGGYYLDNGASLCDFHHWDAERTKISCEDLRRYSMIYENILLPPHLYKDYKYDKWGDIMLPSGQRIKGELFFDESVQKVLKDVLDLFLEHVKYPRTFHLPWSEGVGKDDKVLDSAGNFVGKNVVITEKMDGENTTLYRDYIHARSIDGNSHPSQSWVRNFHAGMKHDIPDGWRICGENIYAKHAIGYDDLRSFFMVFSIWNDHNQCLSWEATKEWCSLLDLEMVPVFWEGEFTPQILDAIKKKELYYVPKDFRDHEGYVIRVASEFSYGSFRNSVAKYVRENHVAKTVHNWRNGWYDSPKMKNSTRDK